MSITHALMLIKMFSGNHFAKEREITFVLTCGDVTCIDGTRGYVMNDGTHNGHVNLGRPCIFDWHTIVLHDHEYVQSLN